MADQMVKNGNNVQHLLIRERSFVRTPNPNARRSLGYQSTKTVHHDSMQHQQMRTKPAIEIYRPPNIRSDGSNKLNVNAPEFTISRDHSLGYFSTNIQHSKSSGNIQHQFQLAPSRQSLAQFPFSPTQQVLVPNPLQPHHQNQQQQQIQDTSMNGVNTNVTPKVKFCLNQSEQQQPKMVTSNDFNSNSLQRSKSMSSADTLTRGFGRLTASHTTDSNEMGTFPPEIQHIVDQALIDPNKLYARTLMILANQIMQKAVEGRRFALPASRFCIAIIAKEHKETFLEAMLNTCRQWYQERDKVLGSPQKIKNSARPRFTAFMAFLTEMFCQLKRRQLQLRTKCDGVQPPLVLLTVLSKCCEDCVRPPVRSLSEIECLFYVLTCVGRDIETHLPQQLESLLSMVRDAFLNSNVSAPAI